MRGFTRNSGAPQRRLVGGGRARHSVRPKYSSRIEPRRPHSGPATGPVGGTGRCRGRGSRLTSHRPSPPCLSDPPGRSHGRRPGPPAGPCPSPPPVAEYEHRDQRHHKEERAETNSNCPSQNWTDRTQGHQGSSIVVTGDGDRRAPSGALPQQSVPAYPSNGVPGTSAPGAPPT